MHGANTSGIQDLGDMSRAGGGEHVTGTAAPRDSTDTQKAEDQLLKRPAHGPGELRIYDQSYLEDDGKDADATRDLGHGARKRTR